MYIKVTGGAVVTTSNRQDLLAEWRDLGPNTILVSAFVCEAALTPSQFRRLPKGLQAKLSLAPEARAMRRRP